MKELGIVVAKYKEDLTWIGEINIPCDIFVYNKGNKEDVGNLNAIKLSPHIGSVDIENLPNIGRESHTYIHHIVNHYSSLNTHTIFLQGDPTGHCKEILPVINDHYTFPLEKINFEFLSDLISDTNIVNDPFVKPFIQFCKVKQVNPKSDLIFGAGAQFVVSKKYILKNPLDFYKNLQKFCIEHVTEDKDAERKFSPHIGPWAMERIWKYIF